MADPFIHLRVHSAYSLAQGAIQPKDLVKLAVKNGMPAVAITDTGNLFGTLEFAEAAVAAGVQPIVGCVMGTTRPDAAQIQAAALARGSKSAPPIAPDRLLLLAQTQAGWQNLMSLSSKGYLGSPGQVPQVPLSEIQNSSDGLICLAGATDSTLGRLIAENRPGQAEEHLRQLKAAFGDRLYIEIQRHPGHDRPRIEAQLLDLAYANDLPLVATNDVHFAFAEMQEPTEALLAIASGRTLADPDRPRLTEHHRFKSTAEMEELFADLPEAIENARGIARRIAFRPPKRKPILPRFPTEQGRSEEDELSIRSRKGLEARLQRMGIGGEDAKSLAEAKPYRDRLEYEIGVINQMGFAGYFLIVSDFIQWSKARDIPVGPGRGSGAGSVVAWSLTITDLDPLRWGLLFERFLNPERVSMPDFDIDFCQDRRDEVIRYVRERYGADRVAQIITFGSLKARAAIRDVGRVIGMPYGSVDAIAKLVPNNPAAPVSIAQAVDGDPRLAELAKRDSQAGRLFNIAGRVEGLYRNASTHAAGVVIGDRPLVDLVPLFQDPKSDTPATQYSMKWVEQAGLVKFDFLGLKTLSVLQMAARLVKAGTGEDIDISDIPLDDARTYELMARADVTGVFQLESGGMRDILLRMKPDRLEDIIAIVALYRPGPMENIPDYIACKRGEQSPAYLHPSLEPVLAETFGIPVYQEQVMKMAQVLAGYSLGGADLLRRAMGKKIQAEMDAQRKTFIDGAVGNGVDRETAEKVFNQVDKFAGYGFNKSHAAAYALISYQTAWMKANHPVAFMAASMSYDRGDTDKLAVFAGELRRMGIQLLPPDVNKSAVAFLPEMHEGKLAIRYGLGAVKGLGDVSMSHLVSERAANGPFASLEDFAWRVGSAPGAGQATRLSSKDVTILASVGAFSPLHANSAEIAANADVVSKFRGSGSKKASAKRDARTLDLFALPEAPSLAKAVAPRNEGHRLVLQPTQDWSENERLKQEREHIGFFLSRHPILAYESLLERFKSIKAERLPIVVAQAPNRDIRVAGIVLGYKERTTTAGKPFWIVSISDDTGIFEALAFDSVVDDLRRLHTGIGEGNTVPIVCSIRGRVDDERLRLTISKVAAIEDLSLEHQAGRMQVTVATEKTAAEVLATLTAWKVEAPEPLPSTLQRPHEPLTPIAPQPPAKPKGSFKLLREQAPPPEEQTRPQPRPMPVRRHAGMVREVEFRIWQSGTYLSELADGRFDPTPEVWKSLRRIPGVTEVRIVEIATSAPAVEARSQDFKAA